MVVLITLEIAQETLLYMTTKSYNQNLIAGI